MNQSNRTPKERPTIFSSDQVAAILAGMKTETRRVVKPQPEEMGWYVLPGYRMSIRNPYGNLWRVTHETSLMRDKVHDDIICPYGQPGDRLWVRESFAKVIVEHERGEIPGVLYRADLRTYACEGYEDVTERPIWALRRPLEIVRETPDVYDGPRDDGLPPWSPSIFLPRALSRIVLEVESVRIERLQEITAESVRREIVTPFEAARSVYNTPDHFTLQDEYYLDHFRDAWDRINNKPGRRWSDDPYVWVVKFRRIDD